MEPFDADLLQLPQVFNTSNGFKPMILGSKSLTGLRKVTIIWPNLLPTSQGIPAGCHFLALQFPGKLSHRYFHLRGKGVFDFHDISLLWLFLAAFDIKGISEMKRPCAVKLWVNKRSNISFLFYENRKMTKSHRPWGPFLWRKCQLSCV